jgi:hypothetical protein
MHRRNTLGRMAVLAGLVLGAASARADVMVYSTGFEPAQGYGVADLNGQQAWEADLTPNDCVVQNADAASGAQAVKITSDGSNPGGWGLGAKRLFADPTGTDWIVTIAQQVKINALGGAKYSIAVGDGVGDGTPPAWPAAAMQFQPDGRILVNGSTMYEDDGVTLVTWTPGQWKEAVLVLDYHTQLVEAYYDGVKITGAIPEPFMEDHAGLDRINVRTDNSAPPTSWMLYDDLSITATPEPASLSLLALGGLGLLIRGRRRRQAAVS